MINLSLNRKDFLYAVEGFASGSHLRQHVWQEIVYKSIPQMSDDDMDYFWFYMRRDIFERYFYELNGEVVGKTKKSSGLQSFNAFFPNEWIKAVAKHKMPENKHVELGREEWWNDLEIYDNFKTKLL